MGAELRGRKGLSQADGNVAKIGSDNSSETLRHNYVPQAKESSATVRGIGPSQSRLSILQTAARCWSQMWCLMSNFNSDVKPKGDARSRRSLPFTVALLCTTQMDSETVGARLAVVPGSQ
jgi:hypothetical protein